MADDLFGIGIDENLIFSIVAKAVCGTAILWGEPYFNKQPYHTSKLSGLAWVDDTVNPKERNFRS